MKNGERQESDTTAKVISKMFANLAKSAPRDLYNKLDTLRATGSITDAEAVLVAIRQFINESRPR